MATIPVSYSKYTTEYYERLKRNTPSYYQNADADTNFDKFLMSFAESLAKMRMAIENLGYRNDFDITSRSQLINIARNFGIYVDEAAWDVQRAFVGLASRWIDRKGTEIGFKALISSYGRNSEIDELASYFPHCGDYTGSGSLLCGESSPVINCGVLTALPDGHKLFDLASSLSILQIKLENYNSGETDFNNALLKALDFLKPIHIEFANPPFVVL